MRKLMWIAIPSTLVCALAMQGLQHGSRESAKAAVDPGWSALSASNEKMHRAMSSVAPSGDNDIDFVQLMLPHHQAAIDMAKAQLLYGKSPEMRRLAQEIIADQQSEIDLMRLWLKRHGSVRAKSDPSPDPSVGKEH